MSDSDSDHRSSRRPMGSRGKKQVKQPEVAKRGRGRPRKPVVESDNESIVLTSEDDEEVMDIPNSDDSDSSNNSSSEEEESKEVVPHDTNFELPTAKDQPKVWVLVGSCGSGKTFALKKIIYEHSKNSHFKFGVVYTATKFTGDYSWSPDKSVMEFDEEHFKKYIGNLKKKVEEGVAKHGKGWKLPHNYCIFDDNNGMLTQSEFMINFISTHRHTSTTVFVLSQMLTARGAVSTTMRSNTSFALMWPTASQTTLKGLYDNFGGLFKFPEFKAALDSCRARKHSCLVLKNSPDNQTIEEQFCTILAGKFPENFQLRF